MSDTAGNTQPLAEAFAAGRPALGAWASLPAAMGTEIMSRAGFDYVAMGRAAPAPLRQSVPV